jgi:omega-amidase
MAGEHKHYTAGEKQALFELNGWHVRPLICYDLRFPVWSRDPHDTDLLLYTANWPAARRNAWNRLLPARAIENLCYVAAVNRVGEDGKGFPTAATARYWTISVIRCSRPVTQMGCFALHFALLDLAKFRSKFPAYHDGDAFELKPIGPQPCLRWRGQTRFSFCGLSVTIAPQQAPVDQ